MMKKLNFKVLGLLVFVFHQSNVFGVCDPILVTSPSAFCVNGADLSLLNQVKVNGNSPAAKDVIFNINSVNGDYKSSKVGVITDQIFRPVLGAGKYNILITYLPGDICEKLDSISIVVNALPAVNWISSKLPDRCFVYGDIKLDASVANPLLKLWNKSNIRIYGTRAKYGPSGLVDSLDYDNHVFRTNRINNQTELQIVPITETIWLEFTDTNGCTNKASVTQKIFGNPIISLDTATYCQDLGSAPLRNSIITPKVSFGYKQKWELLDGPVGVNPSKVIADNSGGAGTDWWINFGTVTEDFYVGTYRLQYIVTNLQTGCYSIDTTLVQIVKEPLLGIISPLAVCENWDTLDLTDYVLLNQVKPIIEGPTDLINYFTVSDYNGDRNHAKTKIKMINGCMFLPSFGAGLWNIKFSNKETGCLVEDSFILHVNDTPDAVLIYSKTVCEGTSVDLSYLVDRTNSKPSGLKEHWSGIGVTRDSFFAIGNMATSQETRRIYFEYTDKNGCTDTEHYSFIVMNKAKIQLLNANPTFQKEYEPLNLNVITNYDSKVLWSKFGSSDGLIDSPSLKSTFYIHGNGDLANKEAQVRICAYPMDDKICPISCEILDIKYYGLSVHPAKQSGLVITTQLGIGEVFRISNGAKNNYEVAIFSTNGQQVFYSNNSNIIWDGGKTAGIYYYKIIEKNSQGASAYYAGKVIVLR